MSLAARSFSKLHRNKTLEFERKVIKQVIDCFIASYFISMAHHQNKYLTKQGLLPVGNALASH